MGKSFVFIPIVARAAVMETPLRAAFTLSRNLALRIHAVSGITN